VVLATRAIRSLVDGAFSLAAKLFGGLINFFFFFFLGFIAGPADESVGVHASSECVLRTFMSDSYESPPMVRRGKSKRRDIPS